jgi:hypothetical protein
VASSVVEEENKENKGNEGEKQQGSAPGANRHQLVQRLLDSSASLPAFINDLLTTQAVTVAGTEAAGFLLERTGQDQANLRPIAHIRPDQSSPEVRAQAIAAFQDLIKPCIEQQRDGAIEVGQAADGSEAQYCLITLLRSEGEIVACSAVVTRCRDLDRARQRLMQMQLVAGYFDLFSLRRNSEQARMIAQSHQHVLQLATSVATAEGFESAGMNLCNELANRAHATRVSLGWVKGTKIKLVAISHTEQFDKKQELVVMLQKVMEECMDQEALVQYDPSGKSTDNVTRDAAALSRTQGGHIVLSLPLRRKAEVIGVVTLEFLPQQKIGPQVANGLAIAVDLLAPQLYDRYQNDRYLVTKAAISTKHTAGAIIGPKHMIAKLVAVLVIAAAVFVTVYKPMYHVSAPFQFVPTSRYTLVSPQRSLIMELMQIEDPETHHKRPIKPGDLVNEGDILCKLDTRELDRQRRAAEAEEAKFRAEAASYRAKRDKQAEAVASERQADAKAAEKELYQTQIDKLIIRAPKSGIILKGDLADRIRGPVEQGDELFIIGDPGDVEVELSVAERDIQNMKIGQTGTIATSALPGDSFDVVVRRVVPMGNMDAKNADNTFKVYATAKQVQQTWRPGMTGEARMDVEPKPLYWILSHRLVDYLKLKLWM